MSQASRSASPQAAPTASPLVSQPRLESAASEDRRGARRLGPADFGFGRRVRPDALEAQIHIPLRANHARALLLLGDLLLLNLAVFGATVLSAGTAISGVDPLWHVALTLIWLALAMMSHGYKARRLAGRVSSVLSAMRLMVATLLIFFLLPYSPQGVTIRNALFIPLLAAVLLALWRTGFAQVFTSPVFQRRVLIVGAGEAGRSLARVIREEDPGCRVVGFIDDDGAKTGSVDGVPIVGGRGHLREIAREFPSVDIVLAITHEMHPELLRETLHCFASGVRLMSLPDAFEAATGRIPLEHVGDRWFMSLPLTRDTSGFYAIAKRVMDIVLALIGLTFFLPLLPFLALAVKLDSPGPAFYRPERLGQGGRPFRLWKLRTMVANADRIGDPTFTGNGDPRITRLGNFLRRSHLDELPQLINILRGEMSVVGPRPERHVPEFEDRIPFYRARCAVRPGAAGWALVNQGYAEGTEGTVTKLQYDLYYIKHQSLALDVLIVAKTIRDILTGGGR